MYRTEMNTTTMTSVERLHVDHEITRRLGRHGPAA